MQLSLSPETRQYIEDQVKAGNFPTPEALVEAAINEWREVGAAELDEEAVAAINESESQCDRGDCVELDVLRTDFHKYFPGK